VKKSFKPTAKKLKRARKDGDIAKSGELSALVISMLGLSGLGIELVFSQQILVNSHNLVSYGLQSEIDIPAVFLLVLVHSVLVLTLFCLSVAVEMLQVGLSFNIGLLSPNFSRLNPVLGIRKMFGVPEEDRPWSIFQTPVYEAFKWFAFGSVVFVSLLFFFRRILDHAFSLEPSVNSLDGFCLISIAPVCVLFFALTLLTLWIAKSVRIIRLSMDHEELKRELRESEGREEQKLRRHEALLELSQRAVVGAVRSAKFVVRSKEY
jgi:flagellar biosynthesis protein FlhB